MIDVNTLVEVFASQVRRDPDAMAVVCRDEALSYLDLDRRSNQIAHWLVDSGAGPEVLVGIHMRRSIELLPAILGILKAGAAYVPLDPEYPTDRLKFIMGDADCRLVLTDHGSSVSRTAPPTCRVLDLSICGLSSQQPSTAVNQHVDRSNLAYVIYTSGSTGQPKGVMVEHRSAVELVRWALEVFDASELSVVLAGTSICFDLSVFEMFVPLSCGGKIVLADSILDLPDLAGVGEVTLLNSVPSAMGEIVRRQAIPKSVRTINIAGEPLKRSLVDRLYAQPNVRRVYNLYGPSEDTTYSTFVLVPRDCSLEPTIGRPVTGTTTAVVGADLRPVTSGEEGELLLMGRGLARGYLKRPRLTAEKFVVGDFHAAEGERAYRTGDRVRGLSDGDLEFLGRFDHQVKVRGYRIELLEIESHLSGLPQVDDCAVIVDRSSGGFDRLHAFIQSPVEPNLAFLRAELARHLPKYMIPNLYTFLAELPKTPSGKIDRQQLLELSAHELTAAASSANPQEGDCETRLARIWSQVLGIASPGWDDHFLDAGGDSLSAVRIVSRINHELGANLSAAAVLRAPTVRLLATQLRAGGMGNLPALIPHQQSTRSPASFAQRRLWFQQHLEHDAACYNVAVALRLSGPLDRSALRNTLNRIVELHELLRSSFAVQDDELYQQTHPAYRVELTARPIAEACAERKAADVLRLVRQDLSRPFDLESGRPVRFQLFECAAEEHVLAITLPHIIFDDWSQKVLTENLEGIYRSIVVRDMPAEASDISYADFAAWQRRCYAQGDLEGELQYWLRQLKGAPPAMELPTDFPRPARPSSRGFRLSLPLEPSLVDELRKFGRENGATFFITLLAAFKALLYARTGQSDLVIGSAVAGRNHFQTERILGFFINTLAMRTRLDANSSVLDTLGRVRDVVFEALAHQELPFEKLVEALRPPRWLGHTPIFQVAFGVQNAPQPVLVNAPLGIEALEVTADYARFDLTVWVEERAEADSLVHWTCRADLFREATIRAWHASFCKLLRAALAGPHQSLRSWVGTVAAEPEQASDRPRQTSTRSTNMTEAGEKKRSFSRRTPTRVRTSEPVTSVNLNAGSPLPLLYQCNSSIGIGAWAKQNADRLNEALLEHGGVLLRGFDCSGTEEFRDFARMISDDLVDYSERSSPRTELAQGIYTSTDHPPDQPIVMHNEQSYNLRWPLKIMFHCQQPARSGGQTPIADSRLILQSLNAETVEAFRERGILYVRNYNSGLGLTWQTAFQTGDPRQVEQYCAQQQIDYQWEGERLQTRQVRAALRVHPKTGETIWFNHALFFNVYSLGAELRSALLESVGEEGLSTNTYFGDGEPIPDRMLEDLAAAYRKHRVLFDWQLGDTLVLDNMLSAHGREPFEGPRKVLAAMADLTEAKVGADAEFSRQLAR